MSDSEEVAPSPTLAATRSRRENAGKRKTTASKFEALKKLREARDGGRKMNYDDEEVDNVYDIVEESEYAERVTKRKEEDWIIDDDGEYVEDGREIFDEEDEYPQQGAEKKYKERSKEKAEKAKKDKSNIKNMLLNMPKKQSEEVKIENDELLGDILGQIKTKPTSSGLKKSLPTHQARESPAAERNPFKTKGTGIKKTVVIPKTTTTPQSSYLPDPEPEPAADNDIPDNMDDFSEEMEFEDNTAAVVDNNVVDDQEDVASVKSEETQRRGFTQINDKSLVSGDQWLSSGHGTGAAQSVAQPDLHIDLSQLPTVSTGEGEQVLRMYWIDAFEDPYKHPGTVWLFGKVWVEQGKQWVSSCVTVKNIPRRVFFAQRQFFTNTKTGDVNEEKPVTNMDLYNEVNDKITKRYNIKEFKCRPCEKMYAFEHSDIPDSCEYLEVMYDSKYPSLPPDLRGETFSRVFGAPQTSLEWFLLEQKIKGPGWLDIKCPSPSSPPVSWCKLEANVTDPDNVVVSSCSDDPPPFVTLSLKIGTVINTKTLQNEVSMVGCLAHTSFSLSAPNKQSFNQHFCLLSKPADEAWPYDWSSRGMSELGRQKISVVKAGSERELLSVLLSKIQKLDPDFIIGHDVSTFDLEVLIHRMQHNKIAHWSRLGRLRRSNQQGGKLVERNVTVGRLVADLKISAKELIRCKSYELGALVEKCLDSTKLDEQRAKLTPDLVRSSYTSSDTLVAAVNYCMRDADDALQLMIQLQALPLGLQISQIAGTVFSRTLRGGRAERIEYLLLHAFTQLGYILPDKQVGKKKVEDSEEDGEAGGKGKKKASYAGGLVLEPKKGFYDSMILLLDFNSLYPSIIQEYNICFTTVDRTRREKTADGEMVLPALPDSGLQTGVLPAQIKKLVDSRREVKNILKSDGSLSEAQKAQLNIRQLALKLTANSMYGCLGFSYSRFFAKHLAALVTSKGREILLNTKDLIQKMNLDVIYGDTDSVMVNTNSNDYEEVFKLGREVKQAVNKLYRLLELDIDGVFQYMLLLKKKKYAAMTIEKTRDGTIKKSMELKGLDIVRRDWCQLAADAGKAVIDIIMTDKAEDTRLAEIQEHLETLATDLKEGKVDLKALGITKQLTKDPSDYPDKKSLAHVQVAMRLNSGGGKKLRAGDTVEYVICDDGSGLSATQRAYATEEVKSNKNLKVDTLYYLSQQLHPVVSRLCDPIEGMDSARVALCLGLDPSQYKSRMVREESQEEAQVRDEDKFRLCEKLVVNCTCGDSVTLDSPVSGSGKTLSPALFVCPRPKSCGGCPADQEEMITNSMELLIRKSINKYYQGWLVCEDPGCVGRTRVMPLQFQRAYPVCPLCKVSSMYQEYSSAQLYNQILYVYNLVDSKKMKRDAALQEKFDMFLHHKRGHAYTNIADLINKKYMQKNGYSTVSLCKLFDGLFPNTVNTAPGQA